MCVQYIQHQDELVCDIVDNTQILSGRHPMVSVKKTSFKFVTVYPYTLCSV
jgi:hypothetical protein